MDGGQDVGLTAIQATLRNHIAELDSDQYLELGGDRQHVHGIQSAVESASGRLKTMADAQPQLGDVKITLAYAAALGALGRCAAFMQQLLDVGHGTIDNTSRARALLVESIECISALPGQAAAESNTNAPTPATPLPESNPLIPPITTQPTAPPSTSDTPAAAFQSEIELFDYLNARFNKDGLKTLSFRIGIEDENLDLSSKDALARTLIKAARQREKIDLLIRSAKAAQSGEN